MILTSKARRSRQCPRVTAKLTSKGQLTLLKKVRMCLGVVTGDMVEFVEDSGRIILQKHVMLSPSDGWRPWPGSQRKRPLS